jgi:uncharacterized HhH-GPD family protein
VLTASVDRVIRVTGDGAVDKFISEDPLALVIAMVLDQQIPLEKAFRSPFDLKERLGGRLEASELAAMDPDALAQVFSERPALHRFPRSMASRVQQVAAVITDSYRGDAAAIWSTAVDGKQLLANVRALPGFGDQKARIFVALLGKQLGVRPPGWEKAASPYGQARSFRSVADIDSPEALAKVRRFKQQAKAKAKVQANPV